MLIRLISIILLDINYVSLIFCYSPLCTQKLYKIRTTLKFFTYLQYPWVNMCSGSKIWVQLKDASAARVCVTVTNQRLSNCIGFIPSFMKIGELVQKLKREQTKQNHTDSLANSQAYFFESVCVCVSLFLFMLSCLCLS
jgi:hypothetical protein